MTRRPMMKAMTRTRRRTRTRSPHSRPRGGRRCLPAPSPERAPLAHALLTAPNSAVRCNEARLSMWTKTIAPPARNQVAELLRRLPQGRCDAARLS